MATTAPAQETNRETNGQLSTSRIEQLRDDFAANGTYRLMQNAITCTTVTDVALNREVVNSTDHTFSHLLDDWAVTNQKKSGRCWMFAGLNLLRVGAMRKMNLKEFEFSQNYTLFWDKFERSNYFLEAIIETADRPIDDRTVAFLLASPLDDGGQWNMFVNIIDKHGLVPKAVMPETFSSSDTGKLNAAVLAKLREGARAVRAAAAEDRSRIKHDVLEVVFRILCMHLGTPPAEFDWQWNDKDKAFHRDGRVTPREFAESTIDVPIGEYVCLVHDPRNEFGKTFTVEFLGNVVGGEIVKYLNVEIDLMKEVAMRTIMAGEPVWMGCDVVPMMQRDLGLWDAKMFDFEAVYDTTFSLDKADRLLHHQTAMTHAMLFTGVDVIDTPDGEKPRRWRVENSWGEKCGIKGFFAMNDSWFDEFMFEIAARREYLPETLLAALDEDPIVLPAWDPMGSLAR